MCFPVEAWCLKICELQFLPVIVSALKILMDVCPLQIVLMSLWFIGHYRQDMVLQKLTESKSKTDLWY